MVIFVHCACTALCFFQWAEILLYPFILLDSFHSNASSLFNVFSVPIWTDFISTDQKKQKIRAVLTDKSKHKCFSKILSFIKLHPPEMPEYRTSQGIFIAIPLRFYNFYRYHFYSVTAKILYKYNVFMRSSHYWQNKNIIVLYDHTPGGWYESKGVL